jgi:urease accessory protein
MNLLAALQLADSFFPSGLYTQSHGLESFVAAGARGPSQIEPLLHSYLLHSAGPADALAARLVVRAASNGDSERIAVIDERLEATKLAAEARTASKRCGGRVLLLAGQLYDTPWLREYARRVETGRAPGHQAVALALAGAAAGLDEHTAVFVELHGFAVSLLGAAVRLAALESAEAQLLLARAHPVMRQAAAAHAEHGWEDIGGFAPWIDIMQFQHRHADAHMFVS